MAMWPALEQVWSHWGTRVQFNTSKQPRAKVPFCTQTKNLLPYSSTWSAPTPTRATWCWTTAWALAPQPWLASTPGGTSSASSWTQAMPQFVNKELPLPLLPKGALCKQRFDVTQAWQTPVLLLCLSCTWSRYQLTERKRRLATQAFRYAPGFIHLILPHNLFIRSTGSSTRD